MRVLHLDAGDILEAIQAYNRGREPSEQYRLTDVPDGVTDGSVPEALQKIVSRVSLVTLIVAVLMLGVLELKWMHIGSLMNNLAP